MKRLFFMSITFLSLSCIAQEQPKATTGQPPVMQLYMGHVIKVNANAEGRYGFDILYQGKPVLSQKLNPFTLSPRGLASREDALKVAQWQIQQLTAGAPSTMIAGQPLSSAVARQLNIALD
jgi:hypothetical protein